MDETVRSIRSALVDAIAGEHRLRREAVHERRDMERWEQRAVMAEGRQIPELAAEARARADRHRRSVALYDRRAAEMRVQVERLRDALAATQGHGRAPPEAVVTSLESRIAALEVDRELERLREARRTSTVGEQSQAAEAGREQEGG